MDRKYYIKIIIIFILVVILINIVTIQVINYYNKIKCGFTPNNYNIYVFWTGDNEMSENRLKALDCIKLNSQCNVILINQKNLANYILPNNPLHPSYEYLSFTHRSDYLRTYFMNFYGGGYCDIKNIPNISWKNCFDELFNNDNYWINGYTEVHNGVNYESLKDKYSELIGNGAYICKPDTALTNEWYSSMISLLDDRLPKLIKFPATFPQDCYEASNGKYPLKWVEMLGDIFHPVCYKYKHKLLHNLPSPLFDNYR